MSFYLFPPLGSCFVYAALQFQDDLRPATDHTVDKYGGTVIAVNTKANKAAGEERIWAVDEGQQMDVNQLERGSGRKSQLHRLSKQELSLIHP